MSWREHYPFTSRYLDTDSGRLHYFDEGPREAAPLLFVHGNPTWSFLWRNLAADLRQDHRVIALDHLGCGLSDKPAGFDYRLASHIANLEKLIATLDLKHLTVVVHDWGGPIGLGAAGRHPELVSRLVIFNTATFRGLPAPARISVCRIPVLGPLAVRGLNAFALAATVMATAKGLSPEAKAGLLAPYGSWAERIAIQRFVEDIPIEPGHPSWPTLLEVEAGLSRLADREALLIWGELDWCFTPWYRHQFESRFRRLESHPLADAGHLVTEDASAKVLQLLRGFLSRTSEVSEAR